VTKFARLNVTVPVDDALPVGQIADHLRAVLERLGMESLDLASAPHDDASIPNGEAQLLGETPRKARIYWPAAMVVRAVERPPSTPATTRKRAGRAAEA
jgi:hypothetical protein